MNSKFHRISGFCLLSSAFLTTAAIVQAQAPTATADLGQIWESAPAARLTVPLAEQTPEINGSPDEVAWQRSAIARGFIRARTREADVERAHQWGIETAEAETWARTLYDDEHLYLAFTCREPYMKALRADAGERDGDVHADDAIGIVLMLDRPADDDADEPRVIQLWVNTENVIRDGDNTNGDTEWQLDGLRSEVAREEDGWHVELAIPFEGLEIDPPQRGDVWRVNFARERWLDHDRYRERSTWSGHIEDALDRPDRMAELRFGDELIVNARVPQPFIGSDDAAVVFRNETDHPQHLTAGLHLIDSANQQEQTIAHGDSPIEPGAMGSIDLDYAIQTEGTGIVYLLVRDEAADEDEPLMVVRRPFHIRPLAGEIGQMVQDLERQMEEEGEDWELQPQVRQALPWLQRLHHEAGRTIDRAEQWTTEQVRQQWRDIERRFHHHVRESGWFQPEAVYLTWQRDPATTMTIHWQSLRPFDRSFVQYRRRQQDDDEANRWHTRRGWSRRMPFSERMNHVVELAGLEPHTDYAFRFGPGLPEYRFRTMPLELDREIRVIVGGDTMHRKDWFQDMTRQAMTFDADFAMMGGDLAYANGTADANFRWYEWLDVVTEDFRAPDGRLVPLLVAIGNHEVRGAWHWGGEGTIERAPYFYSLFSTPGHPGYNVIDFGEYLSVLLLDTDHTAPVEGLQTEWLQRVLERRQDRHIFPIYHVPAYPSHRSYDGATSRRIREHWLPLFERYGVRVAFENHDHTYKRTHPMRAEEVHEDGIVFLGDGSWGVGPRSIHSVEETEYLAAARSIHHVILVTIDGETIEARAIDMEGAMIDEVTIGRSPTTRPVVSE